MNFRVGFGFDVHQLKEGLDLFIGGVVVPHTKGALGHSDADVLIHVICDALLGAVNLGDIGRHFPDTDPRYKGIDSKKLLSYVIKLIREEGFSLGNIDSTICLGTEVDILVEDQGYEYLWNTGQTTPSITVTPQDFITIYTLSITDPACSTSYEVEAKYTVTQSDINPVATPDPLVLGDQVTIESSYSYDSYQWGWNWIDVVDINSSTYPGYYQNSADGMSMTDYPESSTWYYVEVTDGACKSLDSVYVVVGPVPYDAISPNGDGLNDEWEILDISSYPTADVQIFNRWGSLIFSSTGENYNNNKWNGEHEGKLLPVGTYYYTINLKDGSELQTGAVTIVR